MIVTRTNLAEAMRTKPRGPRGHYPDQYTFGQNLSDPQDLDRVAALDSLSALKVFVRSAEASSFTAAGRLLGLSSSAVGKAVARLEERLGVRLFHRNTRCITLTQEGTLFLESCRRIFSEIKSVEVEFAQTKGVPKGKLRVSMPSAGMLVIPAVSTFIRTYPEIQLDIDFNDSLVDVIDGGYDVVVRSGEASDSGLLSRRLGTYRLEVVGSPAYFARAGLPGMPEDLTVHACLHRKYPTTGKLQRWPFTRSATGGEVTLPTTATASTVDALISLAEYGVGIACVPDFSIRRQIADGSLVGVLKQHMEHTETFRAIWPASRHVSQKLRAFIDFFAENLLPKAFPGRIADEFATGARPQCTNTSPVPQLMRVR